MSDLPDIKVVESKTSPRAEKTRSKVKRVQSHTDGEKRVSRTRSKSTSLTKEESTKRSHKAARSDADIEKEKEKEKERERKRKEVEEKKEAFEKEKANFEKEKLEWEEKKKALLEEKKLLQSKLESLDQKHIELVKKDQDHIKEIADMKVKKQEREEKLYAEITNLKTSLLNYEKNDEEDESNINWSAPITNELKSGKELDIRGEWKGPTAGGSFNNLTWRNNPMILLNIKKNSTITFSLFQPIGDKQHSMSFYVIKTNSNLGRRLIKKVNEEDIITEAYFSTLKPSRVSVTADLNTNKGTEYIILPACFLPGDESQFVVKIKSSEEVSARLLTERDIWHEIKGQWSGNSAGGCSNDSTFINNPQYLCKVKRNSPIQFHLYQWEKDKTRFDAIGLYLIKSLDSKRITKYNAKDVVKYLEFRNCHEALLSIQLEVGNYILIPCTFTPNQSSQYKLSVIYSEEPIPVQLELV